MISRKFIGKFVFCFGFFAIAFQNISAQEKPEPFTLNDILARLTFTSRIDKTAAQINAKLIGEIKERKVGFELTKDDEQKIKKRGGNPALIRTVKANFLETRSPQVIEQAKLYEKFIACYPKNDLESRKSCLEIAKEFFQKYESNSEVKEIIEYFRAFIPQAEETIKRITEPCNYGSKYTFKSEELNNLYDKLIACSQKTDLETRKSCVALAKEFVKKAEEENLSGKQIDGVKQYIQRTEKIIKSLDENEKVN